MVQTEYETVLSRARRELIAANAELLALTAKIARLKRTVLALSSLVEQPSIDPALGITEGVKAALRQCHPHGLYPRTLRIKLEEAGFDFSTSKNPLAAIHAILKRLVAKGIVEAAEQPEGIGYFWRNDANTLAGFAKTFLLDPAHDDEARPAKIARTSARGTNRKERKK